MGRRRRRILGSPPGVARGSVQPEHPRRRPPDAQTHPRPRHLLPGALRRARRQRDRRARVPDHLEEPDLAESAEGAARGPRPAGPAGPTGPAGATGKAGAAGAAGKNGTNGTNGTNGVDGKNGTDGSARAYATVTEAGALSAVGKNIGSVERPDPGVYCVSFGGGIAPSNSIAIAMPIYGGHKVFMQADPGSVGECKIANAFVIEAHGAGGSLENTAFYVMVP